MSTENSQTGGPAQATIVSLGDDYALLDSRQLVLRSVGHNVHSFTSNIDLNTLLQMPMDILLVCHTVEQPRAEEIAHAMRSSRPEVPILFLSKFSSGPRSVVLQMMNPASDPASLLRQIDRMLVLKMPPRSTSVHKEAAA